MEYDKSEQEIYAAQYLIIDEKYDETVRMAATREAAIKARREYIERNSIQPRDRVQIKTMYKFIRRERQV